MGRRPRAPGGAGPVPHRPDQDPGERRPEAARDQAAERAQRQGDLPAEGVGRARADEG